LIEDSGGVMAGGAEQFGHLGRQILFGLASHQTVAAGGTIRSRASSAAYCRAVWMSRSRIDGWLLRGGVPRGRFYSKIGGAWVDKLTGDCRVWINEDFDPPPADKGRYRGTYAKLLTAANAANAAPT
jgi:hypothetical protein